MLNVDRVINTNYKAVLNVSQIVGKGMIDEGVEDGTIVNLSSLVRTLMLLIVLRKIKN